MRQRDRLLCFLIILTCMAIPSARSLEIYLNNTANVSDPDGTYLKPFKSFSQAYNAVIHSNINQQAIVVYFMASSVAYDVSMDVELTGNEPNGINLTFTSLVNTSSFPVTCSELPKINVMDPYIKIKSSSTSFHFSYLTISSYSGNKTLSVMDIESAGNALIGYKDVCFEATAQTVSQSSKFLSINSYGLLEFDMSNIMFDGVFSWNLISILDIHANNKYNINLENMMFTFKTEDYARPTSAPAFSFKGSSEFSEGSTLNMKNIQLTNISAQNLSCAYFSFAEVSNVMIRDVLVQNVSNLLPVDSTNSELRLFKFQNLNVELSLNMQSITLSNANNTSIISIASSINSLNISDVLIENSIISSSYYFNLAAVYDCDPVTTINQLYMDKVVITGSSLNSVVKIQGICDTDMEPHNPLVPPYRLNINNMTMKDNIVTPNSMNPNVYIAFLTQNADLLIQNSYFSNNFWNAMTLFGDSVHSANIYLINNMFKMETLNYSTFISTELTIEFDDSQSIVLYRLLFLKNNLFEGIEFSYEEDEYSASGSFIYSQTALLIMTGNIFKDFSMSLSFSSTFLATTSLNSYRIAGYQTRDHSIETILYSNIPVIPTINQLFDTYFAQAMDTPGYPNIISNNTFFSITNTRSQPLFYLPSNNDGTGSFFIENNLIYNASWQTCLIDEAAGIIQLGTYTKSVVTNNVFFQNKACFVFYLPSYSGTLVENNTILETIGDKLAWIDASPVQPVKLNVKSTAIVNCLAANSLMELTGTNFSEVEVSSNIFAITIIRYTFEVSHTLKTARGFNFAFTAEGESLNVLFLNNQFAYISMDSKLPNFQYYTPQADSLIFIEVIGVSHLHLKNLSIVEFVSSAYGSTGMILSSNEIFLSEFYMKGVTITEGAQAIINLNTNNFTLMDSTIIAKELKSYFAANYIFSYQFIKYDLPFTSQLFMSNIQLNGSEDLITEAHTRFFQINVEAINMTVLNSSFLMTLESAFNVVFGLPSTFYFNRILNTDQSISFLETSNPQNYYNNNYTLYVYDYKEVSLLLRNPVPGYAFELQHSYQANITFDQITSLKTLMEVFCMTDSKISISNLFLQTMNIDTLFRSYRPFIQLYNPTDFEFTVSNVIIQDYQASSFVCYSTNLNPNDITAPSPIFNVPSAIKGIFDYQRFFRFQNITGYGISLSLLIVVEQFDFEDEIIQADFKDILLARYSGSLIASGLSTKLNLTNVIVNVIKYKEARDPLVYLFNDEDDMSEVRMVNCIFASFSYSDQFLVSFTNSKVYMESVIFSRAGQVELIQSQANISQFSCINSHTSVLLGGCLIFNQTEYSLMNSKFVANFAKAGAVYSIGAKRNQVENNTYSFNSALLYGPNEATQPVAMKMDFVVSNIPETLTKYYAYSISTDYSNGIYIYLIKNASSTLINNAKLVVYSVDERGNVIFYDSSNPPTIKTNDSFIALENTPNSTIISGRSITLDKPGGRTVLNIIQSSPGNFQVIVEFNLRECMTGEHLENGLCKLCDIGFYSLSIDATCSQCNFTHVTCQGGDLLDLEAGYWRAEGSAEIFKCMQDNISRCKGGTTPRNCEPSYSGALCQSCDYSAGYTLGSGYRCVQCSDKLSMIFLKLVGTFLVGYLYELYSIYTVIQSNTNFIKLFMNQEGPSKKKREFKQKYYLGIQIRLLTSYTQFLFIIFVYIQYTYIDLFSYVNTIQAMGLSLISNPSTQQSSSLECLFLDMGIDPNNVTYYKVLYWLALPFLKIVLTIFIFLVLYSKNKTTDLKSDIWIAILTLIINEQPGILLNLSKLYSCFLQNLDGVGFAMLDPNISCSDPTYLEFTRKYVLPGIILWGMVIPIGLYIILRSSRDKLSNPEIRKKFGGIINSYNEDSYYWGLMIMLFKLALMLAFCIITTPATAFNVGLVIMIGYYYLFNHLKPYSSKEFTNIEKYSIVSYILTLFLLQLAASGTYADMIVVNAIIILILNVGVLFYILSKIIGDWRKSRRNAVRTDLSESFLIEEDTRGISMIEAVKETL